MNLKLHLKAPLLRTRGPPRMWLDATNPTAPVQTEDAMRILALLFAVLCCTALSSPAVAATPAQPAQPSSQIGTPDNNGFDPYIAEGYLETHALPVAGCYLWDQNCWIEDYGPAPHGTPCNPNNPYCKCDGAGHCINMPPG